MFDPGDSTIRFVYSVDEVDAPEDPTQRFPLRTADESATAWVILKGEPLNLTAAEFARRRWGSAAWQTGTDATHWIGMPLRLSDGKILGALVIQSYHGDRIYSDEDAALFGQIADHISTTLEKLTATQRLEHAIIDRTRQLELEVVERRKAEQLQRDLYEIAALSATDATLEDVYRTVHDVTSRLLYARNLLIMQHHEAEQVVMNALLHAFDGRSGGAIKVQGDVDGEDVVLSVSDDGNGMAAADLKQFFDPFFTMKRGSGGTGLGAHIVFNQFTNLLGKTIRVTSAPGAGTQVRMRLPRTLGAVDAPN